MSTESAKNDANLIYVFGLLGGGLSLGFGMLMLYYSFGYPMGPMANHLDQVGFTGVDNITRLPASNFSFGFILIGALTMIGLNAVAWKHTDGY